MRWLADNAYSTNPKRKTPPLLWDGAKIQSEPLPTLDYDSYMGSANGTRETLYNLLKYGFSFVKGVKLKTSLAFYFALVCSVCCLNGVNFL